MFFSSSITPVANKDKKTKSNVPGKFYVDETCIDCDLCRDIAPDFFARDNNGHSKVIKQPNSSDEVDICVEAMDSCPAGAIGNDGEE